MAKTNIMWMTKINIMWISASHETQIKVEVNKVLKSV